MACTKLSTVLSQADSKARWQRVAVPFTASVGKHCNDKRCDVIPNSDPLLRFPVLTGDTLHSPAMLQQFNPPLSLRVLTHTSQQPSAQDSAALLSSSVRTCSCRRTNKKRCYKTRQSDSTV
eukprot:1447064-Rhodomonas_salina.4